MRTFFVAAFTMVASFLGDAEATTLFEFDNPASVVDWFSVDDRVMGGASVSQMTYDESGLARFSGDMSLANNGGFASVRFANEVYDLSNFTGVELRVKGDNKSYQFRFQTNAARVFYRQYFEASDKWTTVRLPFEKFEPVLFGRPVGRAPQMNTSLIRSVTFMLSDKQAGEFELLIDWIRVY